MFLINPHRLLFLLDLFYGAAAAYSVRKLRRKATKAMRVRAGSSSPNASEPDKDIGFDKNGNLDERTLINFTQGYSDTLPLDTASGVAGYSLRKIRKDYAGPAVRVRAPNQGDSDKDIGFDSNGELDVQALEDWCAGGDGYVNRWYDQSGNGNHADQGTASNQPKIVNAGSVVKKRGLVALDFDGVDDTFKIKFSSSPIGTLSVFSVFTEGPSSAGTDTSFYGLVREGDESQGFFFGIYSVWRERLPEGDSSSSYPGDGLLTLLYRQSSGNGLEKYRNGSLFDNQPDSNVGGVYDTFAFAARPRGDGTIDAYGKTFYQELIIYSSDQSANRSNIEGNQNKYYQIYGGNHDGFVVSWYDQSGNGNHADQGTAVSQPKIVNAGSVIKQNGRPALEFDGSDDYLQHIGSLGITGGADRSIFAVCTPFSVPTSSAISIFALHDNTTNVNSQNYLLTPEWGLRVFGGNKVYTSPTADTQYIITLIQNGSNVLDADFFENDIKQSATISSSTTLATDDSYQDIGSFSAGNNYFIGLIQEILVYPSSQSNNRTDINSNANNSFGVY